MSQVWTAPAVHLPSLSGPGVCQAGPERQRAPVPPPSQSEPSEVSDWAAVSRRKWTRQQAVRILQPGVEWCHRPSSHLAQAQGLATGSAPPAPPAHPGGETGAATPGLASPCLGVETERPPSMSPLPLKSPGRLERTSARSGCGCQGRSKPSQDMGVGLLSLGRGDGGAFAGQAGLWLRSRAEPALGTGQNSNSARLAEGLCAQKSTKHWESLVSWAPGS